MKHRSLRPFVVLASLAFALASAGYLRAEAALSAPAASATAGADAATQKRAEAKAARLVGNLKLADAARAAQAQTVVSTWFITLWDWHQKNDPQLKDLWTEWAKARSVVPKDEFPGEVIAYRIDDVYASLRPAYQTFLTQLATALSPEQVDAFKESWSRSPGMTRTYNAFLAIAPDMTAEQQKVVYDRMHRAREDAMLTDSDKEIVNIFKRHKVKVEAYIGSLAWAKLHKAYAEGAKPAAKKE